MAVCLLLSISPALTAVLYDLSRQIPQLKKDIQDGLLKMLSLVLMHKPLRHPGMPKGLAHQLASPSLTNIPEASDVGSITLALRTLGSFEFEGKLWNKEAKDFLKLLLPSKTSNQGVNLC